MNNETDSQKDNSLFSAARNLLSGRFSGVLSSLSQEMLGYPFGSLLPYSIGRDGWPLLLLSHLSKHTRNIDADPRCSLIVIEQGAGDVQQLMRLTCMGRLHASPDLADEQHERHFRYFPDSRDYHDQLNFRFYRLEPERFYCIGGFGAARWMGVDRLRHALPFSLEQEQMLLQRISSDHMASIRRWLSATLPGIAETDIDLIGVDDQGLDIRQGRNLYRVPWPSPLTHMSDIDRTIAELISTIPA